MKSDFLELMLTWVLILRSKTRDQKKCYPCSNTNSSVVAATLLLWYNQGSIVKFCVFEHMGVFVITVKNIKSTQSFDVRDCVF